jgi:hypothetical protein
MGKEKKMARIIAVKGKDNWQNSILHFSFMTVVACCMKS